MVPPRREARFIFVALIGALILSALIILPYANTLTLAIVIGIIFTPLAVWLRRYVKNESLAAALTLLVVMTLVVTPLAFFGYRAGVEALHVYERITRDHTIGELTATSVPLQKLEEKLPASLREIGRAHV